MLIYAKGANVKLRCRVKLPFLIAGVNQEEGSEIELERSFALEMLNSGKVELLEEVTPEADPVQQTEPVAAEETPARKRKAVE
jgi:hypothetical protein